MGAGFSFLDFWNGVWEIEEELVLAHTFLMDFLLLCLNLSA